jgi:integrase
MSISPIPRATDRFERSGRQRRISRPGQPARKNCPYVFPADIGDGHFTAAKSCVTRLCAAAKIEGVTPHTLRHTFGSVAGDLGFSEWTIAALLSHAARGVSQGYVHIDEALKLAASRTCEEIAGLLSGQASVILTSSRRDIASKRIVPCSR